MYEMSIKIFGQFLHPVTIEAMKIFMANSLPAVGRPGYRQA
jgi:hypothetical protein